MRQKSFEKSDDDDYDDNNYPYVVRASALYRD